MSCAASKVLSKLNPELAPSEVYASLISLRTKHLKSASTSADLVKKGLVRRLLTLLQRPNTKIVDVTLSILGNLMLESVPRKQVLAHRLFVSLFCPKSRAYVIRFVTENYEEFLSWWGS